MNTSHLLLTIFISLIRGFTRFKLTLMKGKSEITSVSFGNYIRKIRIRRKYSQYFMAHALEISQNSYCLLENGNTKINLERIVELALIFEIDIHFFILDYLNEFGPSSCVGFNNKPSTLLL